MRTVGEILKKARLEKKLTLDEVEKKIKIRKKFLIALEENQWEKLPSLPYIKGFLRNYSSFLNLKPDEIVAIFRRHFSLPQKAGLLPKGVIDPLNQSFFQITPQTTVFLFTILFFLIFFGYLFLQYKTFISPPNLVVYSPKEGEIINNEKVLVSGKTDIDAIISVNNQKIALSENGKFSINLNLNPGVNTIIIESIGKNGKKKAINRTVQRQDSF